MDFSPLASGATALAEARQANTSISTTVVPLDSELILMPMTDDYLAVEHAARLRVEWWEKGYRPVPVCNYNDLGQSPGKRPVGEGWHQNARMNPPLATSLVPSPLALNTGMLCDDLRIVDIDISDVDVANEAASITRKILGPASCRFRENSARLMLLYLADTAMRRKRVTPLGTLMNDNGKLAQVEVLGVGQQVVVFGYHETGVPMRWRNPIGVELRVLADLPSRSELVPVSEEKVTAVLQAVAPLLGADPDAVMLGKAEVTKNQRKMTAADLAAPSAVRVIDLFERMPNPKSCHRDHYVEIMIAASGCVKAAMEIGSITPAEYEPVVDAICRWVCRWEGGRTSVSEQLIKWDIDWSQRPGNRAGWGFIKEWGRKLGLTDLATLDAQDAFSADLDPLPQPKVGDSPTTASALPNLVISRDLTKTVANLIPHLAKAPGLFDRDGVVVQLSSTKRDNLTLVRVAGPHEITLLSHKVCQPVSEDKKSGILVATTLPERAANLYLASFDDRNLRLIKGVTASPLLAADGSIQSCDGYDPATQMYCNGVPALSVPDQPTRDDASRALLKLRHVMRGFPFKDPTIDRQVKLDLEWGLPVTDITKPPCHSESTAICGLVTAVCRASLPLAPAMLITAPDTSGTGTGKGLLVRMIAAIATGVQPAAVTSGDTSHEFEKRLVAALIKASPVIFIDNVNGTDLKSDQLASAITEERTEVRELGLSRMVTVYPSAWIAVTGNGLRVSEDLLRRFLPALLDAKTDNAEGRDFPPGFLAQVTAQRAELLSAVLTIWRWGRQNTQTRGMPLGSFGLWSAWVRDPLLALGCKDPVAVIQAAKAEDPQRQRRRAFLNAWTASHGAAAVKASEVDASVLAVMDWEHHNRQSVATELSKLDGMTFNGIILRKHRSDKSRPETTYTVTQVAETEVMVLATQLTVAS